MAETLSEYNPYSLLHIPLYGILTLLLAFSVVPIRGWPKPPSIRQIRNSNVPGARARAGLKLPLFSVGGIAFAVGILDEVHQLYVPGRDASVGDIGLDFVGIVLALIFLFGLFGTGVLQLKE